MPFETLIQGDTDEKRSFDYCSYLFIAFVTVTGCYKDGDGKLELKEPKKELSEMPERKNWLEMDISDPDC
ncbi:MAG: hypothetical protein JSR32_08845 [Proteobacteria bacterium]|nr:hypothetical protein [Pseudomonadota bacterium]